jgi:hypothetical protein
MANPDTELDDLSKFASPRETAHTVPMGWWLLFWGLILWGIYYLWTYSPALGGWSQAQDLEGGGASPGANLLATIAFTAIPAAAALGLFLVNRKKKSKA